MEAATAQSIALGLGRPTKCGGKWRCECPICGTHDFIIEEKNGKVLWFCFICGKERQREVTAALRELGLIPSGANGANGPGETSIPSIVATYMYGDNLRKHRWEPGKDGGRKSFSWEHRTEKGWLSGSGENSKPLYLRENIDAAGPEDCIVIVESEKSADLLSDMGLFAVATGGSGGWSCAYAEDLQGQQVVLLPDADTAGERWADKIKADLPRATTIALPGLPTGQGPDRWPQLSYGVLSELIKQRIASRWRTFSAGELMTMEFPPLDQLVEKMVVPGLTMLCSKPKVGKSWMALDIGIAVPAGAFALGSLPCKQADTLMLMLEDSQRRLQDRCRKLLGLTRAPQGMCFAVDWPRGARGLDDLRLWLDEHPATRLVIIDVFQKIRELAGGASAYAEDYASLEGYQSIAQERNIAIMILHHLRKMEADDPMDMVSGTLGITGVADHTIVITGSTENGHRLTLRGRDLPDASWDIELNDGRWSIAGEVERKRKSYKVLDKVDRIDRDVKIRKMKEAGLSVREIATAMDCAKSTVEDVLKKGEA